MSNTAELVNRFEVHNWTDPKLPFIFHTDRRKAENEALSVGNWHDSLEILCVTEGSGTLYCDGCRYDMTPSDILVIESGAVHRMLGSPDVVYHCLIIGTSFCTENGFDVTRLHYRTKIQDDGIRALFENIVTEIGNDPGEEFHVTAIRSAVLSFLLLLNRRYTISAECEPESEASDPIRLGLDYINRHYTESISLDEIATYAALSKYHFLRQFKKNTGYTVITYIRILRCRRAAALLLSSDANIGAIARQCGFDNPSYFSKTFEQYIGMLPGEYRASEHPACGR